MTNLHAKNILLGISGGIAAYKAAELTRLLVKQNANVRVCMTTSAMEFITPLTLQALSGNPVHTDLFDVEAEAAMGHIELAKWADIIIIAPATANTLAKLTYGQADNLLTTIILASKAKLYVAPAMNQAMWHHTQTQENINTLKAKDIEIIGPGHGEQACGDTGAGRLLEPEQIMEYLTDRDKQILAGVSVLITAGPTREAIDPVRYITNRSSGKMGYAIAEAARNFGAKVTLVSGPVNLAAPEGIETIKVESAKEMFVATKAKATDADIFIASAAVADYSPKKIATDKIKKKDDSNSLQLKLGKNPDILAEISHAIPELFTVGFAAETTQLEDYAKGKLVSKKLNMIAANQVGANQGFDVDDNALQIFWEGGQTTLPLTSKTVLARQLLELVYSHYKEIRENSD